MSVYDTYQKKLTSSEDAVKFVKNGDWVDYSFAMNFPELLDRALAKRKDELHDIKIRGGLNLTSKIEVVEADVERHVFTYNSWHFSSYDRKLHDKGLCNYIPMTYRYLPPFYRNHLNVDIAFLPVSEMNKEGYFSMGATNSATREILKKAKIVVLEVNEHIPFSLSSDKNNLISIDEVDHVVIGTHDHPPSLVSPPASEADLMIAKNIVTQIENGSVIQLGIGSLPDTIGKFIAESDLKNLGCHTEMLGDAYAEMFKSGKLTNSAKNTHKGVSVWTIALGTELVFEWLHENPTLSSFPVEYVNAPEVIALNDKVISVNSALEVDLYGQICAETVGYRNISGSGGQLDFLTGAFMSNGGKGFVCLSSTFTDKEGTRKSRIVPILTEGNIVTDPRSQAFYFATEYGIANLAGLSTWERAEKIISLAHPDFRDELIRMAEKQKIWRR